MLTLAKWHCPPACDKAIMGALVCMDALWPLPTEASLSGTPAFENALPAIRCRISRIAQDMDDARMRHAPPPQPSSPVTTLRALVMIACLVGIPTMALRGTAFSAMIREYLVQKLGGSVTEPETRAGLDEAPPFVPDVTGAPEISGSFADAPTQGPTGAGTNQAPVPNGAFFPGSNPRSAAAQFSTAPQFQQGAPSPATIRDRSMIGQPEQPSEAVLANYDRPAAPNSSQSLPPANLGTPQSEPVDDQGRLAQNASVAPPPQAAQTVGQPSTVDQFLYIQQRLRDLGANYYLLENWGNEGNCYRFHCRVAVANSDNFTKHFEATDEQPLGAMTRVLADVEAWRRGSPTWDTASPSRPNVGRLPDRPATIQANTPHGPYMR